MMRAATLSGHATLARYLARRFLFYLAAVFAGCLALIFVIDTVENLRRAGSHDVGLGAVILLSLFRLPSLSELVLPFAVLFAAMMTFLMLTKSLELVVARAAGVSAWQFLTPALALALVVGIAATTLYNPLAASLKARHEALYADMFETSAAPMGATGGSIWLRQQGVDGPSVMHARAASGLDLILRGVKVLQYDTEHRFVERIDARRAVLEEGRWRLSEALVMQPGREPERHSTYLVSTFLSPTQVHESLAAAETVSFWSLPGYIEIAESAGLPAVQYRLQYQTLLARPLLLCAMVLIAATVSLRVFRFGSIGPMILGGIVAGFVLYVVSKLAVDLGTAGAVTPFIAAWVPVAVALLLGMTMLLYQEDG